MPTCARSATMRFSPGPCPCTSADGLSTRRYSAGRLNLLPSSNSISRRFAARFSRNSTGHGPLSLIMPRSWLARGRRQAGLALLVAFLLRAQGPRLVDQHDRNAVADRIGEPGLLADQLLRRAVVAQPPLGQRTDEDFEKFRIDVG